MAIWRCGYEQLCWGVTTYNYVKGVVMLFFRIGRSTGYKPSELRSLVEGSSLYIGSKEIEVINFN